MKFKIILCSMFLVLKSYCFNNEFEVVVRDKSFNVKIEPKKLQDLTSDNSFEGKYFKIVLSKSDVAISFNSSKDTVLRAATIYYHMTKARNYFVKKLKSNFVENHPKIVVRINITNKFNNLGHFAHDNLDPQYNNAVTVPAGDGHAPKNIAPWNTEIWFRPAKKIHYSELGANIDHDVELKVILQKFRQQSHILSLQKFLSLAILGTLSSQTDSTEGILNLGGGSIVAELAYQTSGFFTKLFSRKWFHLDCALVPEVIYHEFAHLALNDFIQLNHSTPVNEGMADYFAAAVAGKGELATRISKYNTFDGKNADNSLKYKDIFETKDYANADFVLGLLWSLRKIIGEDESDQFIFRMRRRLNINSTIRGQLLEAILSESKSSLKQHHLIRYKLYRLFYSKGL